MYEILVYEANEENISRITERLEAANIDYELGEVRSDGYPISVIPMTVRDSVITINELGFETDEDAIVENPD